MATGPAARSGILSTDASGDTSCERRRRPSPARLDAGSGRRRRPFRARPDTRAGRDHDRFRCGNKVLGALRGRGSGGAEQQEQDERAGGHAHERRHCVGGAGERPGLDGRDAEGGETGQPGQPIRQPAPGEDPDDHGEDREHDVDPGEQHGLVVAAELLDHEVLDRDRGQVDHRAADRDHRLPRGPGDAGHHLGHPKRGRRGQQPGQGADRGGGPEQAPHALHDFFHHHEGIRPSHGFRLANTNKSRISRRYKDHTNLRAGVLRIPLLSVAKILP